MVWLTGWNRRKSKIINGSTSSQTNYQMQLTIYKGSGADTTTDIYLGTNVRNDFGDVRFTSSDGSTLLNYWIESYTSGISAIVWIQTDSIPASPGTSTIYVYYDNSSATSTSNGTQVFEGFDLLNYIESDPSSHITLTNSRTLDYSNLSRGENAYVYTNISSTNNFMLEWDAITTSFINSHVAAPGLQDNTVTLKGSPNNGIVVYINSGTSAYIMHLSNGEDGISSVISTILGIRYYYRFYRYGNTVTLRVYSNSARTSEISGSPVTYNDVSVAPVNKLFWINTLNDGYPGHYGTGDIRNLIYRKYVSPEPTWSCSGGEEVYTISWLSGWNRRKSKIVNGSTFPQTNYQMKLTVHKTSGSDTSTDIYLGTNVRNDFGDVRFTKNDGSTLLNYWIDPSSLISGISTDIWIQIDSIPASPCTSTIYIYYDNSSQTSISNGNNTFILFDDFDDLNYNGWTVISGQWSATNGYLQAGTSGIQEIKIPSTSISGVAWEYRFKAIGSGNSEMFFKMASSGNGIAGSQYYHRVNTLSGAYFDVGEGGTTLIDSSWTPDANWHDIGITRTATGLTTLFLDNVNKGSGTGTAFTSTSWLAIFTEGTNVYSFDNIRIRKYASPEPTFGLSSTEELGITAIFMILSTNTCPGPCSITANVTWQNLGTSSITFRPAILINGTIIINADADITIAAGLTGSSIITTPTLLVGTHSICPYPN